MDMVCLSLSLTPHGRLVLTRDTEAPGIHPGLAERLQQAFERGAGHGLLLLGADEAGSVLPPVHSYWRDFGARYVTALCTGQDSDAARPRASVAAPSNEDLELMALAAPPMLGAEYLAAAALEALWREMDAAFGAELSESKCGVQDFLRGRNPAWNLVGRVHFNVAENREDPDAPFAFLATYTTRLSAQATAQHLPLGQALREYAGAGGAQTG